MWNLFPHERLRWWQQFRQKISSLPLDAALEETENLWSYAPFVKNYLTTDNLDNWPDPWELLYENTYCSLAKALGIMYTVWLSDHGTDPELRIYRDPITKENYNLVWFENGKYVLNYLHDQVVNKKQINKNLELIRIISSQELNLDRLK
jgi:hypothetical protein